MDSELELAFRLLDAQITKSVNKCKNDVERNIESMKSEIIREFAIDIASALLCIPEHDFTLSQTLHSIDKVVERWLRK